MQILDTFPAQQRPHFCIFWQIEEAVNFILHCQVQYHIVQFHKKYALSSTIPHTSVPQEINIVKYNTTYFSSTRNIHCQLQYHIQQTLTDSTPEDLFLPWHQLLCNCLLCFSLDLAGSTCGFSHQNVHWLRTCFFLHQKRKLSNI